MAENKKQNQISSNTSGLLCDGAIRSTVQYNSSLSKKYNFKKLLDTWISQNYKYYTDTIVTLSRCYQTMKLEDTFKRSHSIGYIRELNSNMKETKLTVGFTIYILQQLLIGIKLRNFTTALESYCQRHRVTSHKISWFPISRRNFKMTNRFRQLHARLTRQYFVNGVNICRELGYRRENLHLLP